MEVGDIMRQKLRVSAKPNLNIRSAAGTSNRIVGSLSTGEIIIVNGIVDIGNQTWYKLEDGRGWVCGYNPGGGGSGIYLEMVQDLEESDPPQKSPEVDENSPIVPTNNNTTTSNDSTNSDDNTSSSSFSSQFNNNTTSTSDAEKITKTSTDDDVETYTYLTDYSFVEENLKKIRNNLNLIGYKGVQELNYQLFHNFNRFKVAFPDYHLSKTFAHIFFTRPDLNIINYNGNKNYSLHSQLQNEAVFYYLFKNNPDILISLTSSFSADHDFHPFLSNTAQSFELSDEYIKTMEHGETFTGYKVQYGRSNIESKTAGNISISFTDDNNFSIYKTLKAWVDYISKVYRGELVTKDEYIYKKILDYACSIYFFLCGPDDETLLFWSKYFGIFPTNIPASTSSWSKNNLLKIPEYSINFAYAFKEDFSPLTLAEFNMNSSGNFVYKKTYESSLLSTGKTLSGSPFIESITDSDQEYVFKLRFRK